MSRANTHIVLLGDSIFDNSPYVRESHAVIDHLRTRLKNANGGNATLLARDGATLSSVSSQLRRIPSDATHVFLSAGGNDALGEMGTLYKPCRTMGEALAQLGHIRNEFQADYEKTVKAIRAQIGPKTALTLCTIYHPCPESRGVPLMHPEMADATASVQDPQHLAMVAGLSTFNDVIIATAVKEGLPVMDVRTLFNEVGDYATPIEPSSQGGDKLAKTIVRMIEEGPWGRGCANVYA